MSTWRNPDGRRSLAVLGAAVGLVVISNITATIFWHLAGGVGLLDLDGGANLLHPAAGPQLPAPGTPARILAILASYTPHDRLIHDLLLCTLDLVFPPLLGLTGWTTIAWASRAWPVRRRAGARLIGATLALAYLSADWAENVTELLLLAGHRGNVVSVLPHLTNAKLDLFAVMAAATLAAVATHALVRTRTRTRPADLPAIVSSTSSSTRTCSACSSRSAASCSPNGNSPPASA